jgi:hypothetical protein
MRILLPAFRLRRFVTFLLLLSFAAGAVSGVVLFVRPEGGIARWVGWSALGLDKRQWEATHIAFVLTFLLSSVAHIWYNWRPLVAYLGRGASRRGLSAGRLVPSVEFVLALGLTALVAYATLGERPPVTAVLQLRADIKDGKFVTVTPPPVAEAERLTVVQLSRRVSVSEAQMVSNARRRGIIIRDTSAPISRIALEHQLSPEEVYEALQGSARP